MALLLALGVARTGHGVPVCVERLLARWFPHSYGPVIEPYDNYDPATGIFRVRWYRKLGDKEATREALRLGAEFEGGYFPGFGYVQNDTAFRLARAIETPADAPARFSRSYLRPGVYMYVVTVDRELVVGRRKPRYPHPSLLGGLDPQVRCAGHLHFDAELRLILADNLSGHFGTEPDCLDTVLRPLLERLPRSLFHDDFLFEHHEKDDEGRPRRRQEKFFAPTR